MAELSDETARDLVDALKAVANKASVEETVTTGLALVLIKKGILDAAGIEIMRSAALATYTNADASLLAAINERVDGLHSLLDKPEHGAAAATKYDS